MKHFLSTRQFTSRRQIEEFLGTAHHIHMRSCKQQWHFISNLNDKLLAVVRNEPSTRTRLSFEAAVKRMGGDVLNVNLASSSEKKGETFQDTIKTVSQYCDGIIVRHSRNGAAEEAASVASVPVINAGDGSGEHPTQALLDLFTIWTEKGQIDGLKVLISGDVKHSRTTHSLLGLLRHFDVQVWTDAPAAMPIPEEYTQGWGERLKECVVRKLALPEADVLYLVRPQKERWGLDRTLWYSTMHADRDVLDLLSPQAVIMHPLPKTDELPHEAEQDPRCVIWKQVFNGLPVRIALLDQIFRGEDVDWLKPA